MKNITHQVNYITEYLTCYKQKVEILNKIGLFDEAKHFELFAIEIARLWFEKDFHNSNEKRHNEPFVDLYSLDKDIYVQVSTASDSVTKINNTVKKIDASEQKDTIKNLYFILLHEFDLTDLKLEKEYEFFDKENNVITLQSILAKVKSDVDFCNALYSLLNKCFDILDEQLNRFHKALEQSEYDIAQIKSILGNDYTIDVSKKIEELKTLGNKNNFILGNAGVGKTTFCKLLLQDEMCLFQRAEIFTEKQRVDDVWGVDIDVIFKYLGVKRLSIFIDSLESIADSFTKTNVLGFFLEKCKNYENIRVFFTCRTCDSNAFVELQKKYNMVPFELVNITQEEFVKIKKAIPSISKIPASISQELLVNPWYLDKIIKCLDSVEGASNESNIRDIIWDEIVCKDRKGIVNPTARRDVIRDIVFRRAKERTVYVYKDELDLQTLDSLVSDDILLESNDKKRVRVKYDIFEDICFEREIDKKFDLVKGDNVKFFSEISEYKECIYRRYHIWLANKLLEKAGRETLINIIFDSNTPIDWVEKTIVGIVKVKGTANFFVEAENILLSNNEKLDLFIKLVNLYAFQIDYKVKDYLSLVPLGDARGSILSIITKNKLYETREEREILKIIEDYSKSQHCYDEANYGKDAKTILIYYLDKELDDINKKRFSKFDSLRNKLKLLYKFAKICKEEIISIWEKAKNWMESDNDDECWCATYIIQDVLKIGNFELCAFLSAQVCDLAEYFWRFEYTHPRKKEFPYYMGESEHDKNALMWGLSPEMSSRSYNRDNKLFWMRSFIFTMLQMNFWQGLKFIIDFINKSVDIFNEKNPSILDTYVIKEKDVKNYWGHAAFWDGYRGGATMPQVIQDLLMSLEYYLVDRIPLFGIEKCIKFLEDVKEYIINNSNNIFPLPIINSIGFKFSEYLKGYSLPLATNIDFVMLDMFRAAKENQYSSLNCMGILSDWEQNNLVDFNNQEFRKTSLQQYVFKLQFDIETRDRVFSLLDELYKSIEGDEEEATLSLNIQKMDLRKTQAKEVEGGLLIETVPTGPAKKVLDEHEKSQESIIKLIEKINSFCSQFSKVKEYDLAKLVVLVDEVIALDRVVIATNNLNDAVKVLVLLALSNKDLIKEKRGMYVDYMLSFLDELFNSYHLAVPGINKIFEKLWVFNKNEYIALWKQLNFELPKDTIQKLEKKMLFLIIQGEKGGELIEGIRTYLKENKILELKLKNILCELIKIEQKERIEYYSIPRQIQYHFDFEKSFDLVYKNPPKSMDVSVFYKEHVDINFCFAYCNFNLSILDEQDYLILTRLLSLVIKYYGNYHEDEKVDYYSQLFLSKCLNRSLLSDDDSAKKTIELLFSAKCENYNHHTQEFYEDIFTPLVTIYFDSYNEPEMRKKLCCIWEQVDAIIGNDEEQKKRFYNCIMFTRAKYCGDWEKCRTAYSLDDKRFINNMLLKYGKYDLAQAISNIYGLKFVEFLPEVLLSLNELIINRTDKQTKDINDSKAYLVQILYTAIIKHKEEIRERYYLENAFKSILNSLISLFFSEAAILLDNYETF